MTRIAQGGVIIERIDYKTQFKRHFKKLTPEMQTLALEVIKSLQGQTRPPGLRFEKLKGYKDPAIYTVHITGNYKLSFEVSGSMAILRCIGTHNKIDRAP